MLRFSSTVCLHSSADPKKRPIIHHYIQKHTVPITKNILIIKSQICVFKVQLRIGIYELQKTPCTVKGLIVPQIPVKMKNLFIHRSYFLVHTVVSLQLSQALTMLIQNI